MPAPHKRTRSTTIDEPAADPLTPSSSSTRPSTRRAPSQPSPASVLPSSTQNTDTPSRPIQTRSSTSLAPPTPLTRSTSLLPSTRRSNSQYNGPPAGFASGSSSSSSPASSGPSSRAFGSTGRVGLLTRTQSSPSISTRMDLKNMTVGDGGGGGGRGKGDPEEDVFGGNSKRHGRGKENVPPKKDGAGENIGETGNNNARKRLRVNNSSKNLGTARGRSGSMASVRSESSSGPSMFSRRSTTLLSPSPSPSTATSCQSIETASSIDPLDVLDEDELDVDATPTKARIQKRQPSIIMAFPTPPPSSSPALQSEVDMAGKRIALVRMDSSISVASTTVSDTQVDLVEEDDNVSTPLKAKNPYKQLKSFLRLSSNTSKANTTEIIGREDEKAILKSYFTLRSTSDVGLYVSGPPGTGKTALVTAMGRELVSDGWKVVEVGCMGSKSGDLWNSIAQQLDCGKSEDEVHQYLDKSQKNTFIILDEIDSLLPPPPALPTPAISHALSRLFSLPLLSKDSATIKLVAISNTLDLTVRARLNLPNGARPQVLPFKAYSAIDLVGIVNSRLQHASLNSEGELVKVDEKAVELLTRKVEAQNGDLRMCLASLTSAINLAEIEWVKKTFTAELDENKSSSSIPLIRVSLPHVIKAFNSHTQQLKAAAGSVNTSIQSPTTRKIKSVPLQGKLVLVSILIYHTRVRVGLNGCPSIDGGSNSSSPTTSPSKHGELSTSNLYATYSAILSHPSSAFQPANESDYRDLLSNLETLGLVSLHGGSISTGMSRSSSSNSSRSKNINGSKVELYVREDEIKLGLGVAGELNGKDLLKGIADEEIAKVWEREQVPIVKARERVQRAAEILNGLDKD